MTDEQGIDEIQVPISDEMGALMGALKEAGGELPEALRDLIASQILFMPADLTSVPSGAPEGMNALDMYSDGLDMLVKACAEGIKEKPEASRLDVVQFGLNRFAVTGFSAMEIAALLSVAIERLARQYVAMKPATYVNTGEVPSQDD
jgi:hypothetical protein